MQGMEGPLCLGGAGSSVQWTLLLCRAGHLCSAHHAASHAGLLARGSRATSAGSAAPLAPRRPERKGGGACPRPQVLGGLFSIDDLTGFEITKLVELPEPYGIIIVWGEPGARPLRRHAFSSFLWSPTLPA